jgi:TetR/AcrR family transcriptional regulator
VFERFRTAMQHRLSGLRGVDDVTIAKLMVRHFVEFSAANPQLHRIIMQESKRASGRLDWLVETHVRPLYENAVAMFERLAARGELAPVAPAHLYYLVTGAGASVFVMAPECQRLAGVDPFAPEFVAAHADLVVDLLIRATTKESP